ncbi:MULTISPECIES: hypothetical protein [unclassified Agarivorans]|uniref:hypothetical protein n=1 Tax=unclassified Agarivorans TaxID=2636026 RepID=UPI003D7CEF51
MSQNIVLLAIKSLIDENKQPSLALIKARLSVRQPMPVVIAALNAYKRDPTIIKQLTIEQPVTTNKSERQSLEQRITHLESQLALLVTRINQLESKS